jgi:hypothetical protein
MTAEERNEEGHQPHPNEVIEVAEDITKAKSLITQAKEQAERLKAENDRTEAIAKRMEAAKIQSTLGGHSEAGQEPIPKKKLTDEEYAEAVLKGEVNPLIDDGYC